ncbi:DNA topoisomerase IB [soil metagenome]
MRVPRLRTVSPNGVGWTRRRAGRGWIYIDEDGANVAAVDTDRCRRLVIPPAWQQVWICPADNGHIQAVGTDAAGRRQYLYHPEWRRLRDADKFDRILTVARSLQRARERVMNDLHLPGMPYERALATAFRLLDLGFFRVGGETYAEENGSFGLATLRKKHVSVERGQLRFRFMAKSGKEQDVVLDDEPLYESIQVMRRRRSVGAELLAYQVASQWRDVSSDDINAYLKDLIGAEVSAKDFRTWHATVLAAVALSVSTHVADTSSARKRAVGRAMAEVANYLGNTPSVARASYVDPRFIDLFEDGVTIEGSLRRLGEDTDYGSPATHGVAERAVLDMLSKAPDSSARARRRRS